MSDESAKLFDSIVDDVEAESKSKGAEAEVECSSEARFVILEGSLKKYNRIFPLHPGKVYLQ